MCSFYISMSVTMLPLSEGHPLKIHASAPTKLIYTSIPKITSNAMFLFRAFAQNVPILLTDTQ